MGLKSGLWKSTSLFSSLPLPHPTHIVSEIMKSLRTFYKALQSFHFVIVWAPFIHPRESGLHRGRKNKILYVYQSSYKLYKSTFLSFPPILSGGSLSFLSTLCPFSLGPSTNEILETTICVPQLQFLLPHSLLIPPGHTACCVFRSQSPSPSTSQ